MNSKNLLILLIILGIVVFSYFRTFKSKTTESQEVTNTSVNNSQNAWKTQAVDEIGLKLKIPSETTFRKEIGDNYGQLHTVAFYIEKGDQNNPEYQLYGLFLADKESSDQDLERSKTEMDKSTIKEASIDNFKGIEGIILGPKTRYITIIQKDGRLFSASTIPPTSENKELTEEILKTFDFQ